MKLSEVNRSFKVNNINLKEIAKISLEDNEMITFIKNNKEYDFTAKEWGYYVTPSINGRLKNEGFKTALVVNNYNKLYVMIVDMEKINEFKEYLLKENSKVICWLDEWFTKE
jgi:hypothetical protein